MKTIDRTIFYTLGRALAFNVVLPAWAVYNMVTGKQGELTNQPQVSAAVYITSRQ